MNSFLDSLTFIALGVGLVVIGRWGIRHAPQLVPANLEEDERERRERVLVRGSVACQCLAVLFVIGGALRPLV